MNQKSGNLLSLGKILSLILAVLMIVPISISAATLFSDDFEDGNSADWSASGGSWSVVSDGSMVYKQIDPSASYYSSAGASAWTNYSVQAKVKVLAFSGTNSQVGLCARFQSINNFYCMTLSNPNILQIRKKVYGAFTTLVSKTYPVQTGILTMKLVVNGSLLQAYVNGILELTATDSNLTSGKIGLITVNAAAEFDDVLVQDFGGGSPTPTYRVSTPTPTRRVTPTPTPPCRTKTEDGKVTFYVGRGLDNVIIGPFPCEDIYARNKEIYKIIRYTMFTDKAKTQMKTGEEAFCTGGCSGISRCMPIDISFVPEDSSAGVFFNIIKSSTAPGMCFLRINFEEDQIVTFKVTCDCYPTPSPTPTPTPGEDVTPSLTPTPTPNLVCKPKGPVQFRAITGFSGRVGPFDCSDVYFYENLNKLFYDTILYLCGEEYGPKDFCQGVCPEGIKCQPIRYLSNTPDKFEILMDQYEPNTCYLVITVRRGELISLTASACDCMP